MTISDEERARIIEEEKVRAEARVAAEAEVNQKAAKATGKGCLGCLGVVVALSILFAVVVTLSRDDSPEAQAKRELSGASAIVTVICENAVESRLRSPGTADFPFGHVSAVRTSGPNAFMLASYVDSQNGFGAVVRTNFVCEVTGAGSGLSGYRLANLTVQ